MLAAFTGLPSFMTINVQEELSGHLDKWLSTVDIGSPPGHSQFFPSVFENLRTTPENTLVVGNDELLDFHLAKALGAQTLFIGDKELTPTRKSIQDLPKFLKDVVQDYLAKSSS